MATHPVISRTANRVRRPPIAREIVCGRREFIELAQSGVVRRGGAGLDRGTSVRCASGAVGLVVHGVV